MGSYSFSSANDTIVATAQTGFEYGDWIYAGNGDDHVTIEAGIYYVSEAGNDTIIGDGGGALAFWFDPGPVNIDLSAGIVQDAQGGIDNVTGITELHLSQYGAQIIGSGADELVYYFGGESWFDLGDGDNDRLIMYKIDSSEYRISTENNEIILSGEDHRISLRNVERIEFTDKTIYTNIFDVKLNAEFAYDAWSFLETEKSPGYTYAGVFNEPALIYSSIQESQVMDLDGDGDLDFFGSLQRGYRSGIDTRTHFVVLENQDGQLVYNDVMAKETPFITGSRRIEILDLAGRNEPVLVSVAHDTAIEGESRFDIPWRLGDIAIIGTNSFEDLTAELIPNGQLPHVISTGRNTAVDAHSLATGDVNGDGLEDIVVGDMSAGPFVLLQQSTGQFQFQQSEFFRSLDQNWFEPSLPNATEGFLLDLHMADLNGDGFDDLVAGWGHATVLSRIFFNDGSGGYSLENSNALPESVYGNQNNLHMETLSADFDGDGDLDLVVLNSRYEPFYGGNYLQFLENNGAGSFTDKTIQQFGDPNIQADTFGPRLTWTDNWKVLDANSDGHLDILGHSVSQHKAPIIWLNLGNGSFAKFTIRTDESTSAVLEWADFDGDGALEYVSFNTTWTDSTGEASINRLSVFELSASSFESLSHDLGQSNGKDNLFGTPQNDVVDGMGGHDTMIVTQARDDSTIRFIKDGSILIIDRNGLNGTDRLRNVENIEFSDSDFDLTNFGGASALSEQNFGSFIELYIAYFNRAPDAIGLNFWGTAFANGTTLEEMATLFIDQNETLAAYPLGTSNSVFAETVFDNVLGRTPDQAGLDFWVGALNGGDVSRDQFILEVLRGAKSDLKPELGQEFVDQQLADQEFLTTKTDIGAYFAVHKGMSDVDNASAAMALFDGTEASIDTAVTAIDDYYADALDPNNGEFLMQVDGVLDDPFAVA